LAGRLFDGHDLLPGSETGWRRGGSGCKNICGESQIKCAFDMLIPHSNTFASARSYMHMRMRMHARASIPLLPLSLSLSLSLPPSLSAFLFSCPAPLSTTVNLSRTAPPLLQLGFLPTLLSLLSLSHHRPCCHHSTSLHKRAPFLERAAVPAGAWSRRTSTRRSWCRL